MTSRSGSGPDDREPRPPAEGAPDTTASAPRRSLPKGKDLRPDDGRLLRGQRSRERIREAARELFREKGFDGATLRAIAARAGMGASSIYRHVQSKEELLIDELAALQEEAWRRFREQDDRSQPTPARVRRFLEFQHQLLAEDRDLTAIALRAMTRPEARVARRVLILNDRTIGLLVEILQMGRTRNRDLSRDVDVLEAARAIFHITLGARIPWANGIVTADACLVSITGAVELLFGGLATREPRRPSETDAPSRYTPT